MLAQQIRELVATNTGAGVFALPGALELVTALAGTRPLTIASNSPAEITREYLQATGIPEVFDAIVGAGDADHPNPAPDLYQETCRRLGVPCSLVVVLEDSLIGVQAARAAVFAIPNLAETRPVAHRSFPTLADPELWDVLCLTAAPDAGAVPQPRHPGGVHARSRAEPTGDSRRISAEGPSEN